jgi:hypothetical protein
MGVDEVIKDIAMTFIYDPKKDDPETAKKWAKDSLLRVTFVQGLTLIEGTEESFTHTRWQPGEEQHFASFRARFEKEDK